MERAARGTLPPFAGLEDDRASATRAPRASVTERVFAQASEQALMVHVARAAGVAAARPVATCAPTVDLATTCPSCSTQMQPEHAHYRCPRCGYRDSCCF